MTITLDGITLPPDLQWVDEYNWSAVGQNITKSLAGALIVEESAQQKGRRFSLEGDQSSAWITRATLDLLQVKKETAGLVMTLIYFGTSYQVMFRRDVDPIDALQRVGYQNPDAAAFYTFKIHLMEVA